MKRTFKTIALCTALGLLAAGCQKEIVDTDATEIASVYHVSYVVDGEEQSSNMPEERWDGFVDYLFTLAEQGHSVSFYAGTPTGYATKGRVTYTTKDKADAKAWATKMVADGYQVDISYNPSTHIYTCVAIK